MLAVLFLCLLWMVGAARDRPTPLATFAPGPVIAPQHARVHLSHISSIHLTSDGTAATKRYTKAPPQLECVGGKAWFDSYRIGRAMCIQNAGEWTCNAETAPGYVVRDVRVVCEGYDTPDDEYVLDGSCSMQYMLDHAPDHIGEDAGKIGVEFLLGSAAFFGVIISTALFSSLIVYKVAQSFRKNKFVFRPSLRDDAEEPNVADALREFEDV